MKVLFATPYKASSVGGISKWSEHIVDFSDSIKDPTIEIDILPMNRGVFIATISKPIRLFKGLQEYTSFICKAHKLFQKEEYDVMHICTSASISLMKDLMMLRLAKKHHVPTVLHFHFGRIPNLARKKNWEWKMICYAIRRSTISITIDNNSYQTLKVACFDNIKYLPNPLAPSVISYINKHAYLTRRESRMILFVGHCVRNKGVYELVNACKDIPNIQLVLLGRITDRVKEDLQEIANNGDWLKLLGERPFEDVLQLMLSCGVFTLPSYSEGFPNVILESMACGCAIISTNVGAIPEMLDVDNDERCGICVNPKDVKGLRLSITYLINNPDLATSLGIKAKQRVLVNYSMEKIWKDLVSFWDEASTQNIRHN